MTCKHVHAFIDALPLAECTPHQLTAAEHHARDCGICRHSLEAARALDSELRRLPEPAPSVGLAAIIMASTARLEEQRAAASDDAPPIVTRTRSDRLAWATMLTGVVVGLGAQVYSLLTGEATLDLTSSRIGGGIQGLIEVPHGSPTVLFLAAGLLLYLSGLFGPLRGTGTPER